MLQCEWPKVWSPEGREAVRAAIETAMRRAMAGSTNSQIRGVVNVDLPHLGSSPPELVLSGIRELSAERTAIMVKLRYSGDFSVTLRGLQINLDTIGSSGEEADANLALPFYCPFEMTLHDILIDGVASIELLQEIEETHGDEGSEVGGSGARGPSSTVDRPLPSRHASLPSVTQAGYAAASTGRAPVSGFSSGYGILLGARGRRTMRPPNALIDDPVGLRHGSGPGLPTHPAVASRSGDGRRAAGVSDGLPSTTSSARAGNAATNPAAGSTPEGQGSDGSRPGQTGAHFSFSDLVSKKARVKGRTVKVQLFGDPIRNLSVASNFASVPGADSKVEGTIRMLITPSIDRMMREGLTFHF